MENLGESILSSLTKLSKELEESRLMGAVSPSRNMQYVIMPRGFEHLKDAPPERPVIPAFMAKMQGRILRLEFAPAGEDNVWWMNIFCQVQEPKVSFTITAREVLGWFAHNTMAVIMDDFALGEESYDSKYIFSSTNKSKAAVVLGVPGRMAQIEEQGRFEHMVMDARFARITRYVRATSDADMVTLRSHLENWLELVKVMETWSDSAESSCEA